MAIIENISISSTGVSLSKYNMANFFKIGYDTVKQKYFYNINKSVYFHDLNNIYINNFITYTVQNKDTWPLISYKMYGTIELWWLICKVNSITNPLTAPVSGTSLIILTSDIVNSILSAISNQS